VWAGRYQRRPMTRSTCAPRGRTAPGLGRWRITRLGRLERALVTWPTAQSAWRIRRLASPRC